MEKYKDQFMYYVNQIDNLCNQIDNTPYGIKYNTIEEINTRDVFRYELIKYMVQSALYLKNTSGLAFESISFIDNSITLNDVIELMGEENMRCERINFHLFNFITPFIKYDNHKYQERGIVVKSFAVEVFLYYELLLSCFARNAINDYVVYSGYCYFVKNYIKKELLFQPKEWEMDSTANPINHARYESVNKDSYSYLCNHLSRFEPFYSDNYIEFEYNDCEDVYDIGENEEEGIRFFFTIKKNNPIKTLKIRLEKVIINGVYEKRVSSEVIVPISIWNIYDKKPIEFDVSLEELGIEYCDVEEVYTQFKVYSDCEYTRVGIIPPKELSDVKVVFYMSEDGKLEFRRACEKMRNHLDNQTF